MTGITLVYKGDRKNLTTLKDANGKLRVEKSQLKTNQYSTEASLFCVNPTNLKGAMYQYVGSLSATGFFKLFKSIHDRVVADKIADKINELTNFDLNNVPREKARKKAKEMFAGNFELKLLLKELDLNEIVRQLEQVDQIHIKAARALEQSPYFTPIEEYISRTSITIGFQAPKENSKLVESIKKVLATIPFSSRQKAIKFTGKTFSGGTESFWIGDNINHYDTMSYDEYIDLLPSALWDDYIKSDALKALKKVIQDNQPIFGRLPLSRDWPFKAVEHIEGDLAKA